MMASAEHPDASRYEQENVHDVYEQIAHHFSSTRYKPWPIITTYLRSLPAGSVGVDIGCGNGKNMTINPEIFIIGSDRSESLVRIASEKSPHDVAVADILDLPHPAQKFDFAICIAVVHHLSNSERRTVAVQSIISLLKPTTNEESSKYQGTVLLYVWALEQKDSRRGWDEGHDQDVMVPWVLKSGKANGVTQEKTFNRYYHLYRKGELEADIVRAGGEIVESGYEKDNWWAIARRKAAE